MYSSNKQKKLYKLHAEFSVRSMYTDHDSPGGASLIVYLTFAHHTMLWIVFKLVAYACCYILQNSYALILIPIVLNALKLTY